MKIRLLSPCKLNLFLYITGTRADGYHYLQTLFEILDYGDELIFASAPGTGRPEVQLTDDFGVPPEQNLICRAAELLKPYAKEPSEVTVTVTKVLPMGGGLGGGSGNAAVTLLTLSKIWRCDLTQEKLLELALRLGADVPVFVSGVPAFAEGIGEILTPVALPVRWYTVCTPKNCHAATAALFAHPELKTDSPRQSLSTLQSLPFENSFAPVVKTLFPDVARLLDDMAHFGKASMSGSGSSCFLSFDTEAEARAALEALRQKGWCGFCARSLRRPTAAALNL